MIFKSILRALHHLGDISLQVMDILAFRKALMCLEDRQMHLASIGMHICFISNEMDVRVLIFLF